MGGPPYDCLANPLGAVRFTFEKSVSSGADPASFDGKDWGALDLFRHFLSDPAALAQVPILNHSTIRWLRPNTLVRFQGMIQDMLGNEFYVGAYKDELVWRTNKYTDICQFPMGSSPDMRVWERRLLYCVPVPGRNSWTESFSEVAMKRCMDWASQQREKRRRIEDEDANHMDLHVADDDCKSSPTAKKMRADGDPSSSSLSPNSMIVDALSGLDTLADADRNFLPCLVKIYDTPESDVKLNDVLEFVGILTFDSDLPVDECDNDESSGGLGEEELVRLPPSKVPRLHCLFNRKLEVHDFLHGSPIEPKPHLIKEIREALLNHLTTIFGNDGVAAHFMLLHFLSRIYARADGIAVGKLSLNLTNLSKESMSVFGTRLCHFVKNLLPFTHCIPLTLEYLNSASLASKKDYELNRLIPGTLQLAEGSHVIFDETQLQAGTLNSVGVENARLLKDLTEYQKVEYDFKYYKMEMTTDVLLLIFSEGKSNIMPADLVIPLQSSRADSFEVAGAEALEAWRWYLTTVRSLPHSIESEMQKVVENDLVAARQADRSLGSQDFSRWLTMARLMSLSFGESSLLLEHWQMVMELERLRRERLK